VSGLPQYHSDGFLCFGLKTGSDGFPSLDLKTSSSDLVILASKSPLWFLSLAIKINRASVCQLRHKTDEERTVWDMRRDLVAYFG
jgi:hypothetical protein